jgi:hypothetical protein
MTETTKRSRRTLLVLLALFFAPLAASFILYYGFNWRPAGGSNHGVLLQPLRQLPATAAPLLGKWALVYVGDGSCDEDCRRALVFARQTRLSLNKDMSRVNWALMAVSQCCDREYLDREHNGMQLFDVSDSNQGDALRAVLPSAADTWRHYLFVIDPRGNIVMRYDVRESPRGLLDDMKKLLKLSHIG